MSWVEHVAITPRIDQPLRISLKAQGVFAQDVTDLVEGL